MMYLKKKYDIKIIVRYILMMLVAIAIWKITPGIGAILVMIFIFISIIRKKPIDMLFCIFFITYTFVGNYHILVKNALSMTILRGTMMIISLIFMPKCLKDDNESRLMTPFGGIMFYLIWEIVISFQGFSPIISYFKLLYYLSIFCFLFGVTNYVNHSKEANAILIRSVILSIISLVLLGSLLLVPFPALSQLTGEARIKAMQEGGVSLFMGMLSQSQALGSVVAIIGTFLVADLAFSIKKWDKFYILLLLLCPLFIFMSSSRTGMGTLVAGIGLVVFLIMRGKGLTANWRGKLLLTINLLFIIGAITVCVIPRVRARILSFTIKNTETIGKEITIKNITSSRRSLVEESIRNFKNKPLQGNGFQVSSNMMGMKNNGVLGFLSAPIEKGVWIFAVLEEGGIIGMTLFCIWLVVLFKLLILRQAYIGACVFFAFIIVNLGEFTLFSMSFLGGICWTLTFAALCLDLRRINDVATEKNNLNTPSV